MPVVVHAPSEVGIDGAAVAVVAAAVAVAVSAFELVATGTVSETIRAAVIAGAGVASVAEGIVAVA